MSNLIRYDAACRALAEAKAVDEVKDIRDQAMAMRLYAKQAKNRKLEADAFEIRLRAEQRVGQMMAAQKNTVGFNQRGGDHRVAQKPGARPTLAKPVSTRTSQTGRASYTRCRGMNLSALPRSYPARRRAAGFEGS